VDDIRKEEFFKKISSLSEDDTNYPDIFFELIIEIKKALKVRWNDYKKKMEAYMVNLQPLKEEEL